ncbi:MAG: S1C family serine protease [Oscillospiraceae bacterium]|jgi:serine protease Do|nr:S1C family serine protease [Oscillospiraceae bacterium]
MDNPNKKPVKFMHTLALLLAVVILGGGTGFTGAYLGYDLLTGNDSPAYSQTSSTESDSVNLAIDNLVTGNTSKELTAAELFVKVHDTVVGIKTYSTSVSRGVSKTVDQGVIGSGVIFTTDGKVLTNYHVIEGASKISVVVNDYKDPSIVKEYVATVIGGDQATDLAVLKISRTGGFLAASLGTSSTLVAGQDICAIGNPLGMEKSITKGIISGVNRQPSKGGYELPSIQIDAAVNYGNSGGPLFDMYGNVIGIVNKKYVLSSSVDNMGFAISIDEAKPIIEQLLSSGSVTDRPVLGITCQAVNEYWAEVLNLDIDSGLIVVEVNPKAPASSVLARGDIITKIEGKSVSSVSDSQTLLKDKKSGDTITLTIIPYSGGSEKDVKIKLTTNKEIS